MSLPGFQPELAGLIELMFEDALSESDRGQLNRMLLTDDAARKFFLTYVGLGSSLSWRGNDSLRKLINEQQLAGAMGQTVPALATTDVTKSRVLSFSRWTVQSLAVSIGLVAILFYGAFLSISWNLQPDNMPNHIGGESTAVGVISGATDVQWSKSDALKPTDTVLSGKPLRIDSGIIELELETGTKVIVEGPADWSVDDDNRVSLRAGKLIATVPAQAVGFIVETPTVKVVDLGTEFGVEVSERGTTEVQVFQGKVDVNYAGLVQIDGSQQSVRMTAGAAKRFSQQGVDRGVTVKDVVPKMKKALAKASSLKSQPILVQGVMASSESNTTRAQSLIDGSGMKGESHATYHEEDDPYGTLPMWQTGVGKVKNEFVLFDFGKPYRLGSMKVWNFNDSRSNLHKSRGVKHADIYISASGKWDPLKEPAEWTLVIDDFKFSVAPGTDDYDTPDVISFDGRQARFVAIVVGDHFGPDPRDVADQKCVGLSEVQFFGERITKSPRTKTNVP